jgi:hypothetical protein
MSWTPALIAASVAVAVIAAVAWPSNDEIAVRPGGQPIVTQRQGDRIRMCWPEAEKHHLLTDAQFLGGEPVPETVELRCTEWR